MSKEDKEEYLTLVSKVAEVDPIAAEYMLHGARNLRSFNEDGLFLSCFVWSDTPQGASYWVHIYNKLNGVTYE